MDRIHLERHFENHISNHLGDGWRVSPDDKGFDPQTALYMPDLVEFLERSAPGKLNKFKREKGSGWQDVLAKLVVRQLEGKGTVQVLRKGFSVAGYQTIECMAPYPDDPRIAGARERYDANILRFMHQVHYQTAGSKSLDFVAFINGIPVATGEVKTELTQTVQDAIDEYIDERHPVEPSTGRKNPLLAYKRGAVVHFAVSEDEVWMCTNLGPFPGKGRTPRFLPFNMGNDGHAGNPPVPDGEYKVHYLWDYILQRDNWLSIFDKFVFEKVDDKQDATGRWRKVATQMFPRYHQFDCVRKLMADVREKGPGQRYLIEHSAGSGKTETISWLAHDVTRIHDGDGRRLFSSAIIVTDRLSLDRNIKKTITQLSKVVGQVAIIGRDADGRIVDDGSKSDQLVKALENRREIVVVTIQTFLWAWPKIARTEQLAGANFTVIIDEAHSSQDGDNATALRKALVFASGQDVAPISVEYDGTTTDEDIMNSYFSSLQDANAMPRNISFFAFTATPKAETKTLFGTPTGVVDDNGNPIMGSFHLYPMRQAIEEGYIIDPLSGYVPYKTISQIEDTRNSDKLVDEHSAKRTIAKWRSLHPTNVMTKTDIIVEHFCEHVAPLLNGEAKAMIVTSSRPAVVRYRYAFEDYLRRHPELKPENVSGKLQFKVPGEPLVAFSDKVVGAKCVMPEDEYLANNPFAIIEREREYSEINMNPRRAGSVESAFDKPGHRFLIVANKFQTGFDQKKLVALYVDKHLGNDIEIVQTYSRVNRTCPGKEQVFVVDFVNDAERVLAAFKKYDKGATMSEAQDPNVLYEIKAMLDEADVYATSDIERFKGVLYRSKVAAAEGEGDGWRSVLYNAVSGPAERFDNRFKSAQDAYATWSEIQQRAEAAGDEDQARDARERSEDARGQIGLLTDFKKKLSRYCAAYTLVTQMMALDDPDMEVFHGFAKLLGHRIARTSLADVDITGLVLADYKISEQNKPEWAPTNELEPMGAGEKAGPGPRRDTMPRIVERLNLTWGDEGDPVIKARTVNYITDRVATDNVVTTQIQNTNNSREAVINSGRLTNLVRMALVSISENELSDLAEQAMADDQAIRSLVEQVYDLIESGSRYDVAELVRQVGGGK